VGVLARAWLILVVMASAAAQAQSSMTQKQWPTLDGAPPLVIAHRGASGYRPEHTLASYLLAIELGADYVEPDLVATRDGHLIARHEPLLDDTTDVKSRAEFASRRTTKTLDGEQVTGFYASDFTLAEIRQLRAVQSNAARSKEYDGKFAVPTFEEILDLVAQQSAQRGRKIGLYPETKHPAFHLALQLPLEDRLLEALQKRSLNRADAPIFIQSFESGNLQYLRARTELPLVQLLDEGSLIYDDSGTRVVSVNIPEYGDPRGGATPRSLADVAKYANAIGPWKRQILRDIGQPTLLATTVIAQAHAADLKVHTYTFRNEAATLAPEYGNDPLREYHLFFELGIDGVFSDFCDTALQARRLFEADSG
jgi:glycerophosphoryl diester phosphodiesterase